MGRLRRTTSWAVLAALLCLFTAACGTSTPTGPTVPTPTPTPSIARPYCAAPDEGDFWTPPGAIDDQGAVLTLGNGPRGVLLIPQSDGDICQWMPIGRELADAGYHVALMNWSQPFDASVRTVYERLRTVGAGAITLVGASQGASYALDLAAELKPAAVVTLSADPGPSGIDVEPELERYAGPLLLIGSEDDMYAPAALTRHLARVHPGREQVLIVADDEHGVALLTGLHGDVVRPALDAFLAEHPKR